MGSTGNPKVWVPLPYMNAKDCSQGFCTVYCPQWCYFVLPPPPPPPAPPFEFDADSGATISPVVIVIAGVLIVALLLICYYTLISKYCGNADSSSDGGNHVDPNGDLGENHDQDERGTWNIATSGLDEAAIESIAVCKYRRGDGLVQGTDCSVCLGEFREDERLRLLPKCSHAFHVLCIDTWFKSHSNCPLCRASVVGPNASAPSQLSRPIVIENRPSDEPLSEREGGNENAVEGNEGSLGERGLIMQSGAAAAAKIESRAFSDLDVRIEIRDGDPSMGRSVSMDHLYVPVSAVLRLNAGRGSSMSGGREQG